jgi:hypothetical protein
MSQLLMGFGASLHRQAEALREISKNLPRKFSKRGLLDIIIEDLIRYARAVDMKAYQQRQIEIRQKELETQEAKQVRKEAEAEAAHEAKVMAIPNALNSLAITIGHEAAIRFANSLPEITAAALNVESLRIRSKGKKK